jgi:hypothetical protein
MLAPRFQFFETITGCTLKIDKSDGKETRTRTHYGAARDGRSEFEHGEEVCTRFSSRVARRRKCSIRLKNRSMRLRAQ